MRGLKGDDAASAAALLSAYRASYALAFPDLPVPTEAMLQWDLHTRYGHESSLFGAFDAMDEPVASGFVRVDYGISENSDLAQIQLCVTPDRRRAGIGSALLDIARFATRERDRRRIAVSASVSPALDGFAAHHDGRLVDDEFRSALDLTAVDRAAYAALAAPSPANDRYRIVRWIDQCPDELIDSYSRAVQAIDDAPTGEFAYEHPRFTSELTRAWEAETVAFGRTRYVVAAVSGDKVVGVTSVLDMGRDGSVGEIDITVVTRAHRGHGLGLRLKADAVLWLGAVAPYLTVIQTWNDAGNSHMLAVNLALGYTPRETWRTYEFDLAERD
jgi:GNAT superfamily N-acetyltransferase